jgi:hypothetical protein
MSFSGLYDAVQIACRSLVSVKAVLLPHVNVIESKKRVSNLMLQLALQSTFRG